mmetsp:Transcript_5095/g.14813  ORF Transcript_5095/g.14813 Transcript_5095/m.14813 type:complete len:292 (-) Transcript_5095:32-907(-)
MCAPQHTHGDEHVADCASEVHDHAQGGEEDDGEKAVAQHGHGSGDVDAARAHEVEDCVHATAADGTASVDVAEADLALEQQERAEDEGKDDRPREVRVHQVLWVDPRLARMQHRPRLGSDVAEVDSQLLKDGALVVQTLPHEGARGPSPRDAPAAPRGRLHRTRWSRLHHFDTSSTASVSSSGGHVARRTGSCVAGVEVERGSLCLHAAIGRPRRLLLVEPRAAPAARALEHARLDGAVRLEALCGGRGRARARRVAKVDDRTHGHLARLPATVARPAHASPGGLPRVAEE